MAQIPPTTAPRPFVFVVMPFDPKLRDVYDCAIKPAAEMAGAMAQRVDEQHFTAAISEQVLKEINKADAIVADMTGKNPNVLYEVGYAHALGKSVVMITQDDFKNLPFDVNHFHHIQYTSPGGIKKLQADLIPKIEAAITETVAGRRPQLPCPLQFRVNGLSIAEAGTDEARGIPLRVHDPAHNMFVLNLTLCNVKSPTPFKADGIFLLAKPYSSVARWVVHKLKDDPDWMHGPHDGYGEYLMRFKLSSDRPTIPYFDVAHFTAAVHVAPPESIAPMRFEVLGEGRRFFFDLLAQVSWK